jgi:hypothetical protein
MESYFDFCNWIHAPGLLRSEIESKSHARLLSRATKLKRSGSVFNSAVESMVRKKIYKTLGDFQADLDAWLKLYNEERPRQGRWCYGKAPMQTFIDSITLANEKMIAA